jgi:DNA polymerase III subunit alpha
MYMPEFVHLHNHSHYSLLDGAATINDLVNAAVRHNMKALALTDHGVMFGTVEFYKKAKRAGIKPILGSEFYIVTRGSRFDKGEQEGNTRGGKRNIYHHIVLLAKNNTGYRNLIKLSTLGHTEGFYYKPRIDVDLLKEYSEGVLCLSACAGGIVSAHLVDGNYDAAKETAILYKEIFGDDFYLEIQNHAYAPEKFVLEGMPRLARELGLKLIGTNDIHYIEKDHAIPHNVLLKIPDANSTNAQDIDVLRYGTDQIYFKSAAEMHAVFEEWPEAIESTLEVAEKCNVELDLKTNHMPKFPIPADAGVQSLDEYFEKLTLEGIRKRYDILTPEIEERVRKEIEVITSMGYAGYFLIVYDFIRAAREMDVLVGPGRGSAAGSIVAYALRITNVDPLEYDLLFERFLNPDRVSMPDIDVDFSDRKREKVIQYVRDKFGSESVSQIITFGTLSSRAVIKDVGRVLGIPLSTVESITKQIPVFQGRVMPIQEALNTIPELRWLKTSSDTKIKDLITISTVLEGMNRNVSTHAAGVVIAPGPVSDYIPLYKTPQTELMTQYNMKDLEDAGMLKMDFLGLRTLTVIEDTIEMIQERYGIKIELDTIPMDDAKTFDLFSRGLTVAVFQFESRGMQEYLKKLKPESINDLVAMNALYRPGPMSMIDDFIDRKFGRKEINHLHPDLETILKETYGVIVYQEQVMKIASVIAGFTLAAADIMRRAMGKKDKALMAEQKKAFIAGAAKNGIPKRTATEIFDLIDRFASYGFNKSHSVAYSVLAYQTAYLKAHYPAEFMAATMTSEINNTDKIVLFIDECRKLGLNVLPPDVNESDWNFVVSDAGVRFGLAAIKNVGTGAVHEIVRVRNESGGFRNIFDFCVRIDLRTVNKKTIESLVQAGAFDTIEANRARLLDAVDRAMTYGQSQKRYEQAGQSNLFDIGGGKEVIELQYPSLPDTDSWSEAEKLSREKALLGFYVSGHPLKKYQKEVELFATAKFGESELVTFDSTVRVCGIITAVRTKIDRKGNTMAFVTIEDFTGKGELIVFSDPYKTYKYLIYPDSLVIIEGKAQPTEDTLKILPSVIYPLSEAHQHYAQHVVISINLNKVEENTIKRLRDVLEKNEGNCTCSFIVEGAESSIPKKWYSRRFMVNPNDTFIQEVHKLLGENSVHIN